MLLKIIRKKSEKESLFTIGLFSNKFFLGAVVLIFVLRMATIYAPFLNPIFKIHPLSLVKLLIVMALSSIVFIVVEIEKLNEDCREPILIKKG